MPVNCWTAWSTQPTASARLRYRSFNTSDRIVQKPGSETMALSSLVVEMAELALIERIYDGPLEVRADVVGVDKDVVPCWIGVTFAKSGETRFDCRSLQHWSRNLLNSFSMQTSEPRIFWRTLKASSSRSWRINHLNLMQMLTVMQDDAKQEGEEGQVRRSNKEKWDRKKGNEWGEKMTNKQNNSHQCEGSRNWRVKEDGWIEWRDARQFLINWPEQGSILGRGEESEVRMKDETEEKRKRDWE